MDRSGFNVNRNLNSRLAALSLLLFMSACGAPTPMPAPVATTVPAGTATSVSFQRTTSACTMPSANAVQFAIDPASSQIGYVATSGLNTPLKGHFRVIGESLALDSHPSGTCIYLTVTFDVRTATAPDSFMRGVMLNAMEADKYPKATFTLTSTDAVSWSPSENSVLPANWPKAIVIMQGNYQLHNQQHSVIDLSLEFGPANQQNSTWSLSVALAFNLSDYGIHLPPALVKDSITFTAALTAVPIERF